MRAGDVTETLELALEVAGLGSMAVAHRPRLLSDNGSSYISGDVGLDAGTATGATVTARQMEGADASPELLDYSLYSDSGRTTNWGNTVDTDTVAGTGTGDSVVHTVYGRIPEQTAPKVDTYSDTITITVTY